MPNATYDYGDLRITLTKEYGWSWDSTGSNSGDASMWYPNVSGPMKPLGSIGNKTIPDKVNGLRATLLVGVNPNTHPAKPAVAAPTDYTQVRWMRFTHTGSCWRPVAPPGYVSCGDLWAYGQGKPNLDAVWCLRQDLVTYGRFSDNRLFGHGSGLTLSAWDIIPENPGVEGTSKFPICAGTHRIITGLNKPDNDLATLPALPLPDRMQRFVAPVPEFTDATRPNVGDTFNSLEQASVTLPFIAFLPATDSRSLEKISSPFLKFSRSTSWYVEAVRRNGGQGDDVLVKEITKGASAEKSAQMTNSAGVNISASGGIGSVSYEVSLNYQFTYTTTSTFTEYSEMKTTETITVPPNCCSILLSQRLYLKSQRGDGSSVLSSMEMPVNGAVFWTSYWIDESKVADPNRKPNPIGSSTPGN